MSTSVMETPRTNTSTVMFSSDNMGIKSNKFFKKGENGSTVLVLEDVAVFRTGGFEDSLGRHNTWEVAHMESMVSNFAMLAERNILPNIPVRSGHPGWLVNGTEGTGKVVGWHTGLKSEVRKSVHDDNEYTYLLASFEIIDEDAQKAIDSGLWRNRSSEIGTYVTNDGAEYFPVYMGFAYVDIPAVEGLNGFSKHTSAHIIKEDSMAAHADGTKPVTPTPPTPPAVPVAEHSTKVETQTPAAHAATTPVFVFKVGGNDVSDFAAVQAHINALEMFQAETIEQSRLDFVNGLVTSGRILASAKEATENFAKSLTDEQFTAWKETQEDAPVAPILAVHGASESDFSQAPEAKDAVAAEVETVKAVVLHHKRSGASDDKVKNTKSYKRLLELDPTFKL